MKTMKAASKVVIDELLSKLRPSNEEFKQLIALQKAGKMDAFNSLAIKLDKKYGAMKLSDIPKVDKKLINNKAVIVATGQSIKDLAIAQLGTVNAALSGLLEQEQSCDCIVPFCFTGLTINSPMTGPANNDVTRGVLGAQAWYDGEYELFNPGDTDGTTRVPMVGSLDINFQAQITRGGNYLLLVPTGGLDIVGWTYVHGHGNSTTCYDAKVWVRYFQILASGNNLVEMTGNDIAYDGTRSEERTKWFNQELYLPARYLTVGASANSTIDLILRCEVHTEANSDGKAKGKIACFGFLANTKDDYNTIAVRV
jgi:hypothetical protein